MENPDEMTKTINKMFPKGYDRARKSQIMQDAKEEFRQARDSFSRYVCEQGIIIEERI